MTTIMIVTVERIDVAMVDIPGTYIHAEMPKYKRFIKKLQGQLINIMCEVKQEFMQHLCYKNRQKDLYLLVLRDIYGCIDSDLLWYDLYVRTLKGVGFYINQYDR